VSSILFLILLVPILVEIIVLYRKLGPPSDVQRQQEYSQLDQDEDH